MKIERCWIEVLSDPPYLVGCCAKKGSVRLEASRLQAIFPREDGALDAIVRGLNFRVDRNFMARVQLEANPTGPEVPLKDTLGMSGYELAPEADEITIACLRDGAVGSEGEELGRPLIIVPPQALIGDDRIALLPEMRLMVSQNLIGGPRISITNYPAIFPEVAMVTPGKLPPVKVNMVTSEEGQFSLVTIPSADVVATEQRNEVERLLCVNFDAESLTRQPLKHGLS